MKLLVAAEGNTLDDRVARKFGHATVFLELDPATLELRRLEHAEHSRKDFVLEQAAKNGVTAVVTGTMGPRAISLLSAQNMQAVFAPGATIREAAEGFLHGKLKTLDPAALAQATEEHEHLARQGRLEHRQGGKGKAPGQVRPPTPRGRHHLQQFGGRGH
jgi:predicted Fe-Mo cluster-binding NifX family protein